MNKKERIDLVVMRQMPELTRSTIKKIIINGAVTYNKEKVMPNYRIEDESLISVDQIHVGRILKNDAHVDILKPFQMDLDIVYEDEHTLIINKENGINSHPENRNDNKSLLNAISFYLINNPKEQNRKARLVNRLDKETSGIIVAAKTLPALDFYSSQFQNRLVKKTYLAVVDGDFENIAPISVRNFLSKNNDLKKVQIAKTGDYSETDFDFVQKNKEYSLVKASPKTGRTHQIRVHLADLGFPIVGDTKYGGKKHSRMMLHSYKIKLDVFSTKKSMEFETRIPKLFTKLTN